MAPELREALREDLEVLVRLHDRELDPDTLAALQAVDFPFGLALLPVDEGGKASCTALGQTLAAIPLPPPAAMLDRLAADFAAIYLNHGAGASPYESVWLDDDHLACQRPMFEVREIYAAAGLQVRDWRRRYDDHLVFQLLYLRHQLGREEADWAGLADFIDQHIGYWLPDFAACIGRHGSMDFYAGLAQVTCGWLERFRDLLGEMYERPRPDREALTRKVRARLSQGKAETAPVKFMPGAGGPSW